MATIEFSLDGETVEAHEGETVLQVARRHGKRIPTLCHDPRLAPFTSCFLCLVELEGKPGFVPSCATKVAPGMRITTDSEDIRVARQLCLELIMSTHYADCVAPCRLQCPDNIDIQTYIAQIAQGEFDEALATIKRTNPFPSVCGRVCPHTCELECRRNRVDEPVAINPLKRFVADLDQAAPHPHRPEVGAPTGKRVAIIGGGPAGLTAAYYLRQKGHATTVFEMNPKPGGMLRYGIPYYRLPEDALDGEIDSILSLGVELRCGQKLGRDFDLAALHEAGYDAVLLAVGAWTSSSIRLAGEDRPGVLAGIDYLWRVAVGEPPEVGRRVVVVGGGNTAVDAARTARRTGAEVTILYRRTRKEMPAEDFEVDEAEREGVQMHFLAAPVALEGEERIERIQAIRMELGEPDASGRRRPVPIEGSEFEIAIDTVIAAIGQKPDPSCWSGEGFPGATRWNTVEADERTYQTAVPWVFTAGDCLTGAATAIEAIAGGRKAALSIDLFLNGRRPLPIGKPFSDSIGRLEDLDEELFADVERVPRAEGRELPLTERLSGFTEVELGIDRVQALTEAGRCLSCGCDAVDSCTLRSYCEDYDVDVDRFPVEFQHRPLLDDHPLVIYDPNKCILCGRCVRICSEQQGAGALGFVNRGFDTTIRPALDQPLLETDCDACGQCIQTCPTAAFEARRSLAKPGPYQPDCTPVVCGFCSVGCRLTVETSAGHYVQVTAEPDAFHNRGNLCVDGSFGHRFLETLQRVEAPRLADGDGGATEQVGWEQALAAAADGLRRAAAGGRIAVLVNGPLTNEEAYLLGRLARTRLGGAAVAMLDEPEPPPDADGPEPDLADVAQCDLLWMLGADPFEIAPVAGVELRRAAANGTPLVLFGRRPARLDAVAQRVVRCTPAQLRPLLAAMAGFLDRGDRNDLAAAGLRIGLKPSVLAEIAGGLKRAERPLVAADGALGAAVAGALMRLLHAAGCAGSPLWLRRPANARGRDLMGLRPDRLPGGMVASDGRARTRLEKIWGEKPAMARARSADEVLAAVRAGEFAGLLVIDTDPYGAQPAAGDWPAGLFVTALALRPEPWTERADVLLPASALVESAGTITALDGRIMPTAAARRPASGKTVFQVLGSLADAMGQSIPLGKPDHVWAEMERLRPGLEDFAGARLTLAGRRWT